MEDAIIRPLGPQDYADARALYVELAGDIAVADGDFGKRQFARILDLPGTTIWGAELRERVVSVATLHIMPNMTYGGRPYCLIENVVTLQAHQGNGHARRVMNAAIEAAWNQNAYKIMLLTGHGSGAKRFYEKLGFVDDQKHGMILRRAPQRRPALAGS